MNLLSLNKMSIELIDNLSQSGLNRLGNSGFENPSFSFYPWIPSGIVKLELGTGAAYTGENSIRFYPSEGNIGKITQRTRLLRVGELYVLLFAARSSQQSDHLFVQFGRRVVRISRESIESRYSYYTLFFRARNTFAYLHFFVKNESGIPSSIDIDTISLYPFSQFHKITSLAI